MCTDNLIVAVIITVIREMLAFFRLSINGKGKRECAWKEGTHESGSGMALYPGGNVAWSWLWRQLGIRFVKAIQSLVLTELERH